MTDDERRRYSLQRDRPMTGRTKGRTTMERNVTPAPPAKDERTMTTKEPKDAVILAARIAKAYPSLSAYSAATLAESLCAIERMQRRHAERDCNGDYLSRGAQRRIGGPCLAYDESERAEKRVDTALERWEERLGELLIYARGDDGSKFDKTARRAACGVQEIELQGDPRGAVLLLRLPNETEAKAV